MTVTLRDADPADAQSVAKLLEQLGHPISTETTRHQLALLSGTGRDRVLVAESDGVVLGVLSLHWTPLLHRDKLLGRITALVVDEAMRGRGVGSRLVAEGERILREAGCSAVEVTSNVRRAEAHDFYLGLGYEQSSAYFRRSLDDLPEEGQPDSQKKWQDL
jgi:GNAT superfamily N-acetyltransferase